MKKILLPVVLAGLVACNDDSASDAESVAPPPIPSDDIAFIDNLVPHHQMALEMAEMAIARATREDVRAMAEHMKVAQQEEIAQMQEIRARFDGNARSAELHDPHADLDMAELEAAEGNQVDVVFLENMIPHHAGAVSLAHRALENLRLDTLREIADKTIVIQTREMNEMLDMLGK